MTRRGTLPGRKPGTRTSRDRRRITSSRALSISASSISTDRRTLLPSSGAAVARIRIGECTGPGGPDFPHRPRPGRTGPEAGGAPGPVRSASGHERQGGQHPAAQFGIPVDRHADPPDSMSIGHPPVRSTVARTPLGPWSGSPSAAGRGRRVAATPGRPPRPPARGDQGRRSPRRAPRCRRAAPPSSPPRRAWSARTGRASPARLPRCVRPVGPAARADVLLVGPGVEDPGDHEVAVGHIADRTPPHRVELLRRSWPPGRRSAGWWCRRTRPAPLTRARCAGPRPRPRSSPRTGCGRGPAPRSSAGGDGSPSSIRSIPMRWDRWSLTDHPGQSVGRSHCSSSSCSQAVTTDAHTSVSSSMTGSPRAVRTWHVLPLVQVPGSSREVPRPSPGRG